MKSVVGLKKQTTFVRAGMNLVKVEKPAVALIRGHVKPFQISAPIMKPCLHSWPMSKNGFFSFVVENVKDGVFHIAAISCKQYSIVFRKV